MPRPCASQAADLHSYRRFSPAEVRRLLRPCFRARGIYDQATFSRPGLPRSAHRVSRDGKPLRPDRMAPEGLGADRHLRGGGQDQDSVPQAQGSPRVRRAVSHRDAGHARFFEANHGKLPCHVPRGEPPPELDSNWSAPLLVLRTVRHRAGDADPSPVIQGSEAMVQAARRRSSNSCSKEDVVRSRARIKCSLARAISPERR